MPLFIANSTRSGGEVQLPLWQWRMALRSISHDRRLAAEIASHLPDGNDATIVRVPLTVAQIETLERAMEAPRR